MPWAQHKKQFIVVRVSCFKRFIDCGRAVNILLIPQAVDQHGGDFQRLSGENSIHRLFLPPGIVTRMIEKFAPEAGLFEPMTTAKFAG